MLDFISNIAKAPGKILDAVEQVPFADTLLDQIPIVNNVKNAMETFDENIAPLVEKATTTFEGFREDPTAAIANLASEVSDLSLEEIANLSPSQLDAIFEDAGVSSDMVNQLVEDTVGYSDPSSSSTYDPSDPNGTVNASNFLGNNGSGNNVVNPFSTSNLANVGNVGTNTTGGNNNTTGGNNNTTTGTTTTGGTDPFQPKYDENFLENFDLGPEVNPIELAGEQRDKQIDQFIAGKIMDDTSKGLAKLTSEYETANQVGLDFVETGNSYIKAATTSMKKKAEEVEQEAKRG